MLNDMALTRTCEATAPTKQPVNRIAPRMAVRGSR